MIEKIKILQLGEDRYLGRHLREEARRLFGIVAYCVSSRDGHLVEKRQCGVTKWCSVDGCN